MTVSEFRHQTQSLRVTVPPAQRCAEPAISPAQSRFRPTQDDELVAASDQQLAAIAGQVWSGLDEADTAAAVESARLAAARAQACAETAAFIQRLGLPPSLSSPADWSQFGTVIPVVAASAGVGTSVVSTVIADILQITRSRVLMIDTADPSRSGLAGAARYEGSAVASPHPAIRLRFSWRAQALLARMETQLPVISPGMVPPPRFWTPGTRPLDATVVDLGHDAWRVSAHPLAGAGAWLRTGSPSPRPILVCRPSRPSLLHAEQVLARMSCWSNATVIAPPAQLVVVGAKRWPPGVAGSAGRRMAPLVETAAFLPFDPDVAAGGITADVTPRRLRDALTPFIRQWGLTDPPPTPSGTGPTRHIAQRNR